MSKGSRLQTGLGWHAVSVIGIFGFGFVSDFELRDSDFRRPPVSDFGFLFGNGGFA